MHDDTSTSDPRIAAEQLAPPPTFRQRLRYLGPGLIITGSIVGSGELIATTKLGSEAGYVLLWLVILGCIVKVFVQIELGRYAISSAETALKGLDRVPGPRLVVSWVLWIWLVMAVAVFFQTSGIVRLVAEVLLKATGRVGLEASESAVFHLCLVVVVLSVAALLVSGRYRLVGMSFGRPRNWFAWDRNRNSKRIAISLDVGKWIRPTVVPEDPDAAEEILRGAVEQ